MGVRGILAGALAVLAASACSTDRQRNVTVTTRMSLDSLTCGCHGPDDCPLDCGGAVGLFAIDPTIDLVDPTDSEVDLNDYVLDSYCVNFAPSAEDTLRMLSTHLEAASFTFPEGTRMALQLVVYPGSEEGCPIVPFRNGQWETTPKGQIPRYAGRSPVQTLSGDSVSFEIEIGCPVLFPECPSSTHKLQSFVRDLSTLTLVPGEERYSFDVKGAQIFYPGGDPIEAALQNIADLTPLDGSPDALYEATSETGFGFTNDCIGTVVSPVPGPKVSTASCEGAFGEALILAQSYYVEQRHIDDVVAALGLGEFPPGGLMIGRITQNGSPANTFTVRPQTGTATVTYFEEDATQHLVERPAGGSWFVVSQAMLEPYDQMGPARCCEYFDAENDNGEIFTTFTRVGLINGVVTATEIATFGPGL